MIRAADEFILLDDVQYTHDWRNRNLIKTRDGIKWLTIPVKVKTMHDRINEVRVVNDRWRRKHWNAIIHSYSRASYFEMYYNQLENLFLATDESLISKINFCFLERINSILGITTRFSWSSDYGVEGTKDEKVLNLCKQARATRYLSGPSAKAYLDESVFNEAGIEVNWMDYSGYPEYNQLFPPFEHRVTILDLVLNEGPNAINYLKSP